MGLAYLIGWAVWHLLNDERGVSGHGPVREVIAANSLAEEVACRHIRENKETPATTRLHIPPPYFSSRSGAHTGYAISGMNSGGWSVQHRLAPRGYRRRLWLADELYRQVVVAHGQTSEQEKR